MLATSLGDGESLTPAPPALSPEPQMGAPNVSCVVSSNQQACVPSSPPSPQVCSSVTHLCKLASTATLNCEPQTRPLLLCTQPATIPVQTWITAWSLTASPPPGSHLQLILHGMAGKTTLSPCHPVSSATGQVHTPP